jgi:tRNA threonylcarbamoyladenosine biosynthesis protein TsaB
VPVSSLATLAQGVDAPRVLAAFDARMQQVYWGAFRRNAQGLMELQGSEQVLAPAQVPTPEGEGWVGAGPGWDAYHGALEAQLGGQLTAWLPQRLPHAADLAVLAAAAFREGRAVAPEQALPVYVRDDVAVKSSR